MHRGADTMPVSGDFRRLGAISTALRLLPQVARDAAVKATARAFQAQVVRGFDAQVAPDGSSWPPRKAARTEPLLVDTGALRGQLASEEAMHTHESGWRFDLDLPYAAKHNFGDPAHNLPQRRFLPHPEEAVSVLLKAAQAELAMVVKRLFRG